MWSRTFVEAAVGLSRPRRARLRRRWWPAVVLFLLVAASCSVPGPVPGSRTTSVAKSAGVEEKPLIEASADADAQENEKEEADETREVDETRVSSTEVPIQPTPTAPAIAELGARLAPAPVGFEALAAADTGPQPVGLTIESIGVEEALVIPVGINADDASMEIPPAEEVGWYRFGTKPGDDGSAVLAAHIAYDGRDGVFRRLAELTPGSVVVIAFDDASTQRWMIHTVTDYNKTKLPDELFAVDGDPRLALITCGGYFNPGLRSYDSNTVAVARPL